MRCIYEHRQRSNGVIFQDQKTRLREVICIFETKWDGAEHRTPWQNIPQRERLRGVISLDYQKRSVSKTRRVPVESSTNEANKII